MNKTKSISFMHAADLHLDSPFKGLTTIPKSLFQEVRNSTFYAFDQLVDVAMTKQVDFILLVGDLFDNEKQSLKAQVQLRKGFERLKQANIQVYLSYGNHDHLLGNPYRLAFPDNVHVFTSEEVTHFTYEKDGEVLAHIHGFSYHNRAVQKNKITEYQVVNKETPYHIATLHGSLHGNPDHDPYAPFSLQQLQATPFDYWALGHIHARAVLSSQPPIIYPGNTQGRHRKEIGDKGCYYVQMTPFETLYEFISLQSIQFHRVEIDVTQCQTLDEIERTFLTIVGQNNKKQLIDLTIYCDQQQWAFLKNEHGISELIEIVNDVLLDDSTWKFIYDFKIEIDQVESLAVGETFMKELEDQLATVDVEKVIADLYQHPIARKYLKHEEQEHIKAEANKILQQELLRAKESDTI